MIKFLLCSCALICCASLAAAETYVVAPDGSGDFPTIQAAVDAAANADVILLTDGVFLGDGNRDIDLLGKQLVVRHTSEDPQTCSIDCGGSEAEPHRAFHLHAGEPSGTEIASITILGSFIPDEPSGGAILCTDQASLLVRNFVFSGNQGGAIAAGEDTALEVQSSVFDGNYGFSGAAIWSRWGSSLNVRASAFLENASGVSGGAIRSQGTPTSVESCSFVRNTSGDWASAIQLLAGGPSTITDCLFDGNGGEGSGGAVHVFISQVRIDHCTFTRNNGALTTGKNSQTLVRNCTFWGDTSIHGTLWLNDPGTFLENCILAGGTAGPAIELDGEVSLSCCDLWGNAGGDWVGPIAEQYGINGNISLDPWFCDPEGGDYHLQNGSPCAPFSPENPTCDLVGAWQVGCGPTAVEKTSWGALKHNYR